MNKNHFILALIVCLTLCVTQINAEYYGRDVPDSSDIRSTLIDQWFTNDLKYVRLEQSKEYTNSIEQAFQVRLEELDDQFAIIVAPKQKLDIDLISSKGTKTITVDVYPSDLAGSWILFRDKKTGAPLSIRYYFQKNSEIYVELRINQQRKVFADFLLFGMYAVRSVPIGLTVEQLYSLSFEQLVECTKNNLPWEYSDIENYLYEGNLQMIGMIREKLEFMKHDRDAAYDGLRKPVYISRNQERIEKAGEKGVSVDSSGFVKWIVDGIIYPLAGSNLEIEPLKKSTVTLKTGSKADTFSQKVNMYFSLDWTRNLAAAYLSVTSGKLYDFENSGCEVTIRPFASELTTDGLKSSSVYISGSGYSVSALKALFYVLAITEPDRFYLGAIRETDDAVPQNIFYTKSVAFFPFFDQENNFAVSVFEDGNEYTIEQFIERNQKTFVNLVRLSSSLRFFPQ